jgi:hypothetical protein
VVFGDLEYNMKKKKMRGGMHEEGCDEKHTCALKIYEQTIRKPYEK